MHQPHHLHHLYISGQNWLTGMMFNKNPLFLA